MGGDVQDAYTGGWAQQAHLSAEHLNSIRGLNRRFLDLAGSAGASHAAPRGALPARFGHQVAPLSAAQRAAAANCPYALFDLRFEDDLYWCGRLNQGAQWRIAEESGLDAGTMEFVRLALFYAWHVASSADRRAHLLLGMHRETAEAFRRTAVDSLPGLAAAESVHLRARWSECSAYWNALLGAAVRADAAALRRVQLSGLQLSVAFRLPSA